MCIRDRLLGDGAAGFSLMDVDTLVRHRLPVVMVCGNNGGWGWSATRCGSSTATTWPTRGPQTWPDRAEAGHLSGSRLERRPVDHHPDDVGGGKRALTRAHPSGAGDPAARALLHDRLDVHRGADRAGRQVLQVC